MAMEWIPKYLDSALFKEKPFKSIVKSEEWNALIGSLIEQGRYNTDALADVIRNLNEVAVSGLVDNSIATSHLINGAVTASKLADKAVTTSKIAEGAVTWDKIDITAGSINGSAMVENSISGSKLVNATVTGTKMASKSIDTGHLSDTLQTAVGKVRKIHYGTSAPNASAMAEGDIYIQYE